MSDTLASIFVGALYVWVFCMWAYGVAVCWRADEIFWAVVSFAAAPVGFLIGVYNWIF